jgi:hypothetical protein
MTSGLLERWIHCATLQHPHHFVQTIVLTNALLPLPSSWTSEQTDETCRAFGVAGQFSKEFVPSEARL